MKNTIHNSYSQAVTFHIFCIFVFIYGSIQLYCALRKRRSSCRLASRSLSLDDFLTLSLILWPVRALRAS